MLKSIRERKIIPSVTVVFNNCELKACPRARKIEICFKILAKLLIR